MTRGTKRRVKHIPRAPVTSAQTGWARPGAPMRATSQLRWRLGPELGDLLDRGDGVGGLGEDRREVPTGPVDPRGLETGPAGAGPAPWGGGGPDGAPPRPAAPRR